MRWRIWMAGAAIGGAGAAMAAAWPAPAGACDCAMPELTAELVEVRRVDPATAPTDEEQAAAEALWPDEIVVYGNAYGGGLRDPSGDLSLTFGGE